MALLDFGLLLIFLGLVVDRRVAVNVKAVLALAAPHRHAMEDAEQAVEESPGVRFARVFAPATGAANDF